MFAQAEIVRVLTLVDRDRIYWERASGPSPEFAANMQIVQYLQQRGLIFAYDFGCCAKEFMLTGAGKAMLTATN
ncbi:MAG: hypothetical protein FWF99_00025 [Desulfovibrionaceae bacterium]|nr:hypothetical protein [Desulfovibrionaceae bacterium]